MERAQYEPTRHVLRKLSWFGQVIDVRVLGPTVVDNNN
jgi:hypothetical protein